MHYLGGADVTRTTVSVWRASGIHTLEDARQREVLMGASGRSGQTYIVPITLNAVLGTKFKPVVGYGGINLINLAMERGEIHGQAASWPTITATKREWVDKNLIANLVTVAMERELPLKIAGKRREPKEREYFEEFVEPHLGIRGIEYLGEVSHGTKVELLQDARATLFPIDWEEPFGLVMIESMACGTPVIATNRGAVPEVIDHGRSGIIVENYREMGEALEAADALDPLECRRYVEERFSPERMVDDYVGAFREAIVASPVSASLSQ